MEDPPIAVPLPPLEADGASTPVSAARGQYRPAVRVTPRVTVRVSTSEEVAAVARIRRSGGEGDGDARRVVEAWRVVEEGGASDVTRCHAEVSQ